MLKKAFKWAVCFAIIALLGQPAWGVIFSDDFESYMSTAEMNAVGNWGDDASTGNPGTLSISGMNQFMQHPGGVTAKHVFPGTTPTNAAPLVWEFDLIDDGVANRRITGGLRDNGGGAPLGALLEMGRYNAAGNPEGTGNVDGYAIRTVFIGGSPVGSGGWVVFPGDPQFQAGMHNLKATIRASDITFELDLQKDGVVDAVRVITTTDGAKPYNVLRFGGPSDLSSSGPEGFDNVSIGLFEPVAGPFNTGVSNTGAGLPGDAVDTHWTVHRVGAADADVNLSPGAPTFVVPQDGFPIPPWVPNDSNSAWISSTQDNDANDAQGFFDYTLFFDVLSAEAPGFMVEGQWAVDNAGIEIFINGDPTGNMNTAGFASFTDFSIDSGFIGGLNTLTFRVENFPSSNNPTGLHVEFSRFGAIPEPASAVLIVVGVAGLAMRRRRHA